MLTSGYNFYGTSNVSSDNVDDPSSNRPEPAVAPRLRRVPHRWCLLNHLYLLHGEQQPSDGPQSSYNDSGSEAQAATHRCDDHGQDDDDDRESSSSDSSTETIHPQRVWPQPSSVAPPFSTLQMPAGTHDLTLPILDIPQHSLIGELDLSSPFILPTVNEVVTIRLVFYLKSNNDEDEGRLVTILPMSVASFKQRIRGMSRDVVSSTLEWKGASGMPQWRVLTDEIDIVRSVKWADNYNTFAGLGIEPTLVVRDY